MFVCVSKWEGERRLRVRRKEGDKVPPHKNSFNLKSLQLCDWEVLEKVEEVERAARGKALKERGSEQKGLIETDLNPTGDI